MSNDLWQVLAAIELAQRFENDIDVAAGLPWYELVERND